MIAAIYCRASETNQEHEEISLQTQLEACLKYCDSRIHYVAYRFSETYSGLALERPELDRLRSMAKDKVFDIVVCYSLDRLSLDPEQAFMLMREFENRDIFFETVTETTASFILRKCYSRISELKKATEKDDKSLVDTYQPPTLDELAAQARDYYRTCKPKVYRQARKDGDLKELCELKAKAAMNYAEALIASGEYPGPAWMRAIRSEILESETD